MAYCRFAPGDVYIFHNVNGFLECCACRLTEYKRYPLPESTKAVYTKLGEIPPNTFGIYSDFTTTSRREMIEHIRLHKKAGHKVTSNPITRLKQEIKELGEFILEEE